MSSWKQQMPNLMVVLSSLDRWLQRQLRPPLLPPPLPPLSSLRQMQQRMMVCIKISEQMKKASLVCAARVWAPAGLAVFVASIFVGTRRPFFRFRRLFTIGGSGGGSRSNSSRYVGRGIFSRVWACKCSLNYGTLAYNTKHIFSRFLLGLGGTVPGATSPLLTFFKDEDAAAAAAASAAGCGLEIRLKA